MIAAGLVLLGCGLADLIRQFVSVRRRWIAYLLGGLALLLLAAAGDAIVGWLLAVAFATAWALFVPSDGTGRLGLWPVAVLAIVCAGAVGGSPPPTATSPLDELWQRSAALGGIPLGMAVLVVGAVAFLLESSNVVVRTALRNEAGLVHSASSAPESARPTASSPAPLKGGRLIGPLERVLVFALTLVGAYTLIAAVLAAKGIVRFPEISRDGDNGDRAEYFLVGSLVSWVTALAAALLVWWAWLSVSP